LVGEGGEERRVEVVRLRRGGERILRVVRRTPAIVRFMNA
jgi:hypothetical protein